MEKIAFYILIGLAVFVSMAASSSESQQLGQQIFAGEVPVKARLRYSTFDLPVSASKCSNCHSVGSNILVDELGSPPELGRARLLTPLKRVSGPPVAYDEESFCIVVTKGRTPSHVLLSQLMPLYELDEQSCKALWEYLSGK